MQTDLLGRMPGRLVCPLKRERDQLVPHPRMNPRVAVLGEAYIVHMQYLSAVPSALLKNPLDNLDPFYDRIRSAYDMMLNGF